MSNDINLKNVICVIKKIRRKKPPENSLNLNIKIMISNEVRQISRGY